MVELCKSSSGDEGCTIASDEEIDVLLLSLQSSVSTLRYVAIQCLQALSLVLPTMEDDCKQVFPVVLCHDCPCSLKFQSCQSKQSNRTAGINSSTCCRCGARTVPYWQILTWRPLKSSEYPYIATYQMPCTAAVYYRVLHEAV